MGQTAFTALLQRADNKRTARAKSRPIENVQWNPKTGKYQGTCFGTRGVEWHPTITIHENGRRFYCDCPDHSKNARTNGPCKHVISLALTLGGA